MRYLLRFLRKLFLRTRIRVVTTYGVPMYYPEYWESSGWDSMYVSRDDEDDRRYGYVDECTRHIGKAKAKIDEYRTAQLKWVEDQFNIVTTYTKHP